MAEVKPISPDAVSGPAIPDEVFTAFNTLILKNFRKNEALIYQKDAIKEIRKNLPSTTAEEIFENGWLDVEVYYRQIGWKVEYDKPGWNEDYEPRFTFSKPKKENQNVK